MKLSINKKYLKLPVNDAAVLKKICFYKENKLIFDLDCKLDAETPSYHTYLNIERFNKEIFDVVISPDYAFILEQTDSLAITDYRETSRPQVHFTARHGWLNDPNGAFFYNGVYNLFFQYNEASAEWGNMSWGHAISEDLVHWEQKDTLLFPDEMGPAFSGGAFVDTENRSGLQCGEHPPILLYYTAAGNYSKLSENQPYTQCIAYSVDGGKTFEKYSKNPIIKHIVHENRDPRVNYSPELECYVMALYLVDNRFMILTSDNLLDWTPLQEITELPDMECPDFYPISVSESNETKWVLSGLNHQYLVGDFKDGKFVPCQEAQKLHFGFQRRASQTFSGLPNGRQVCAVWDPVYFPNQAFRCQLGTPMELSLHKNEIGYYLTCEPVKEFEKLRLDKNTKSEIQLFPNNVFKSGLPQNSSDILIEFEKPHGTVWLSLFDTQIAIDFEKNELHFLQSKIPFEKSEKFDLRIIRDTCTLEIFINGGKYYACNEHRYDKSQTSLSISSTSDIQLNNLTIFSLKSIWDKNISSAE